MAEPVTPATSSAVAYGANVHLGIPPLKIPGVTNLQSHTVSEGYETKEEFADENGNIGLTVFSRYTKTITFTGLLEDGATLTSGMSFNLGEGWTAYIDTGLQISYTPTVANVAGTIKAFKKLDAPAAS